MSGIGSRLREERERLGLSQGAFGDIGGVKANAQGNYEKGDRFPDAGYLAAVAEKGVDVLYVVTGTRVRAAAESLSEEETTLLKYYRILPLDDRGGIVRTAQALAEMAKR